MTPSDSAFNKLYLANLLRDKDEAFETLLYVLINKLNPNEVKHLIKKIETKL